MEPVAEAMEPVAEAMEPVAEAMEPAAEAMEPVTEAMEPAAEAMEPAAEAMEEPAAEAMEEPVAEPVEPVAEVTNTVSIVPELMLPIAQEIEDEICIVPFSPTTPYSPSYRCNQTGCSRCGLDAEVTPVAMIPVTVLPVVEETEEEMGIVPSDAVELESSPSRKRKADDMEEAPKLLKLTSYIPNEMMQSIREDLNRLANDHELYNSERDFEDVHGNLGQYILPEVYNSMDITIEYFFERIYDVFCDEDTYFVEIVDPDLQQLFMKYGFEYPKSFVW